MNPSNCTHSFYTSTGAKIGPQWFIVGFKRYYIYITSYSIRSSGNNPGSVFHLKSWALKGSIDGKKWNIIDNKVNSEDLNYNYIPVNYQCKEGVYRLFKLEQTDKGFTNEYGFAVRHFEIFGTLMESEYLPYICSNNMNKYDTFIIKALIFLSLIVN